MPHLILEHTAALSEEHDLQALCQTLFDALAALPEVPNPSSLKVRTLPCPQGVSGAEPQTFVHATLLALPGRTDAQKKTLTSTAIAILQECLPNVGSLSVNYGDLDAAYTKRIL